MTLIKVTIITSCNQDSNTGFTPKSVVRKGVGTDALGWLHLHTRFLSVSKYSRKQALNPHLIEICIRKFYSFNTFWIKSYLLIIKKFFIDIATGHILEWPLHSNVAKTCGEHVLKYGYRSHDYSMFSTLKAI